MRITTPRQARNILRSLSLGVPPDNGARHYTSPDVTKFVDRFVSDLQYDLEEMSIIQFIYGDYGSGKSHFMKLLTDELIEQNYVVSLVEMKEHENSIANLNYLAIRIFQSLFTKEMKQDQGIAKFILMMRDQYDFNELTGDMLYDMNVSRDLLTAMQILFEEKELEGALLNDIISWFKGEGHAPTLRKTFGINDIIKKEKADEMIATLGRICRKMNFNGLIILIDEAEKTTTSFNKRGAHGAYGNLLTFINTLESRPGIAFLFATTPDFYGTSIREGNYNVRSINIHPALKSRIGKIPEKSPKSSHVVWNIEEFSKDIDMQIEVFKKIIKLFLIANDDVELGEALIEEIMDKMRNILNSADYDFQKLMRPSIKSLISYLTETYTDDEIISPDEEDKDSDEVDKILNELRSS